jgi:hypothetical protein
MHRPWLSRTIAVAACAIALLVAGYAAWKRPVAGPPRPQGTGGRDRPDIAAGPTTVPAPRGRGDAAIASLVEARNVAWAEGQPTIAVGTRLGLGELRCTSGALKLVFDAGALVTLEGPADLEVLSGMRIRAVRGRITARVDDRAKGFAIETPSTLVVDRGTEFGVEVDDSGQTGVVVFEGRVDLSRPETAAGPAPIRRLVQGEALRVGREGGLSRIVAVERRPGDDAWSTGPSADRDAVIRSVRDNIRGLDSPMYYQIVHRGLDDDVPAYVDRPYQWNAVDPAGLPAFLRGADYIMPFNSDKVMTDLQVTVEVARPATLYIFYDDRAKPPPWLSGKFTDTGVDIGLDEAPPGIGSSLDRGPGRSIDTVFSVWRCELGGGGSIQLGAMVPSKLGRRAMYGIAAVPRASEARGRPAVLGGGLRRADRPRSAINQILGSLPHLASKGGYDATSRLHADRAVGGDRDHRRPDRAPAPGGAVGARGGAAVAVRQQPQADGARRPRLRQHERGAPPDGVDGGRPRAGDLEQRLLDEGPPAPLPRTAGPLQRLEPGPAV